MYRGNHPREIVMANGLVRRTWRLSPDAATVGLDNLVTGQSLLRSVRPEALVELDGVKYSVGGLEGQRVHNYLDPRWLDRMTANPAAFHFTSFQVGKTSRAIPLEEAAVVDAAGYALAAAGGLADALVHRTARGNASGFASPRRCPL